MQRFMNADSLAEELAQFKREKEAREKREAVKIPDELKASLKKYFVHCFNTKVSEDQEEEKAELRERKRVRHNILVANNMSKAEHRRKNTQVVSPQELLKATSKKRVKYHGYE